MDTTTAVTTIEERRAEAHALAVEVHRSRPAPSIVVMPPPPAPAPSRLRHEDGCLDCGTDDFRVYFDQPGLRTGEAVERRFGGRCWECHTARAEGGRAGIEARAWREISGQPGVPFDVERIGVLLFSDFPRMVPTRAPWGWVDRPGWFDLACRLWPFPSMWPAEHQHRIPKPPPPPPEPQRPCIRCGTTAATTYHRAQGWFPVCGTCRTAERGGQEGICALAASVVGLTRRIGVVDLRQIAWRWWSDLLPDDVRDERPDPEGNPTPFAYLDLDTVRRHALTRWPDESSWNPDAFRAAQRAAAKAKR